MIGTINKMKDNAAKMILNGEIKKSDAFLRVGEEKLTEEQKNIICEERALNHAIERNIIL